MPPPARRPLLYSANALRIAGIYAGAMQRRVADAPRIGGAHDVKVSDVFRGPLGFWTDQVGGGSLSA